MTVGWQIAAAPGNAPLVLLGDVRLHPLRLLDEPVWVGPSPTQVVVATGRLYGPGTIGQLTVPVTPPFIGMSLWLQALVADPNFANGVFAASNVVGQPIHADPRVIRAPLAQAALYGWTGNFDRTENTRLQGAPIRRRSHRTIDPQGITFAHPLPPPFHHYGLREQMVFRTEDVGATGEEELLVGIAWRPLLAPVAETFDAFELMAAHSDVRPDFTIDSWSTLPVYPSSGLSGTFARNYLTGTAPVSLFAGRYDVRPQDRRADGYMSYPLSQPFVYDGVHSLLLEYHVLPAPQRGAALNGHRVNLMVTTSPNPAARVVAKGDDPMHLVNPQTVQIGFGDNTMHDLLLDFVRERSVAVSPWFGSGYTDWQPPAAAIHAPPGTSVGFEFRGALDTIGTGATPWSTTIDVADGMPAVQLRITFVGNRANGDVPFIAGLELPVR